MAKREQTGFQWDVQPYRFISELQEKYTYAIVQATRKDAREQVDNITQWMKGNAPWKDKSGKARASLVAKLIEEYTPEQVISWKKRISIAKYQDVKERKRLNRWRYIVGIPQIRSIPKKDSVYEAVKKEWQSSHSPVLELHLMYDDNIPYAVWLEIANQGRFGIISRALDYWGTKFINRLKSNANLVQFKFDIADGEIVTQEQMFAEHVAKETRERGRPYIPWSPAVQAEYKRRKAGRKRKAEGTTRPYVKSGKYGKDRYRGPKK